MGIIRFLGRRSARMLHSDFSRSKEHDRFETAFARLLKSLFRKRNRLFASGAARACMG